MIYDSILGTIGKTPVVRIQRLAPKNVTMYVKCEFFNPQRVEELALHVHRDVLGGEALDAHNRGLADGAENTVVDHDVVLLLVLGRQWKGRRSLTTDRIVMIA